METDSVSGTDFNEEHYIRTDQERGFLPVLDLFNDNGVRLLSIGGQSIFHGNVVSKGEAVAAFFLELGYMPPVMTEAFSPSGESASMPFQKSEVSASVGPRLQAAVLWALLPLVRAWRPIALVVRVFSGPAVPVMD